MIVVSYHYEYSDIMVNANRNFAAETAVHNVRDMISLEVRFLSFAV
jgi:hypothetical protein